MGKKANEAIGQTFEFEQGGRTFICEAEAARAGRTDGWWWFSVTPDPRGQRYAPFRMAPDDTRANVEARIVAYYDELLVRRSQPATSNHWGRRPGAGAAASSTAAAAAPAAEPQAESAGTITDLAE